MYNTASGSQFSSKHLWIIGSTAESVFPEPVGAINSRSLPSIISGIEIS